jgi:hypothetical protein
VFPSVPGRTPKTKHDVFTPLDSASKQSRRRSSVQRLNLRHTSVPWVRDIGFAFDCRRCSGTRGPVLEEAEDRIRIREHRRWALVSPSNTSISQDLDPTLPERRARATHWVIDSGRVDESRSNVGIGSQLADAVLARSRESPPPE